jgi:hypothetical protein
MRQELRPPDEESGCGLVVIDDRLRIVELAALPGGQPPWLVHG